VTGQAPQLPAHGKDPGQQEGKDNVQVAGSGVIHLRDRGCVSRAGHKPSRRGAAIWILSIGKAVTVVVHTIGTEFICARVNRGIQIITITGSPRMVGIHVLLVRVIDAHAIVLDFRQY